MRALAAAVALAVLVTAARADTASDLAEARRLEATLEYEPALVIVERVIARGGATREELVERHLLAGKLAAGLDRRDVARAHFARVLALAPTTSLPDGTSPKLTEPFDEARALAAPLQIAGTVVNGRGRLDVRTDTLELVDGIEVRFADGPSRRQRGTSIELPAGARAVEVRALDAYGNTLWTMPIATAAAVQPTRTATVEPVPLYKRWTVWTAASGAAVVVGGLSAWRFRVAQQDWDDLKASGAADYSRLRDVEDRGQRWGLVANISFGIAAATGIAAIVCAATGASEPRVIVSATPTSTGLVVSGAF